MSVDDVDQVAVSERLAGDVQRPNRVDALRKRQNRVESSLLDVQCSESGGSSVISCVQS